MALIPCPECNKMISDKAFACINCGFPLNEFRKETIEGTKQIKNTNEEELPTYKVEIINCNGSHVKALTTVMNYNDCDLATAKKLLSDLPTIAYNNNNIDKIKCFTQDLTDAGIEHQVYKGNVIIELGLKQKDKKTSSTIKINHDKENGEAIFKICPICNRFYNDNTYYCKSCNVKLDIKQDNKDKQIHNVSSNTNVITCPYCQSTNTQKITTTAKAINFAVFGLLGTKRHKQWHCNSCSSDF